MTTTTMTAAEVLTAAADLIERNGLNQDGHFVNMDDLDAAKPQGECRMCALGAMNYVYYGDCYTALNPFPPGETALRATLRELRGPGGIAAWNDAATQDEVVTMLRRAARHA